jgi:hypothetical protein
MLQISKLVLLICRAVCKRASVPAVITFSSKPLHFALCQETDRLARMAASITIADRAASLIVDILPAPVPSRRAQAALARTGRSAERRHAL